jgi:hypothetical protein
VFPPNTPKDRVQIMRKGLADTFKDLEFLADAKKVRLDLNPLAGDELQNAVARTFNLEQPLVDRLKEILK